MEDLMNALPETDVLLELAITYGGKLLLALLTLIVGLWLIGKLNKGLNKLFKARDFEQTLQTFLSSLVGLTLKALLLISVISMVGVQMTSFIAILGAAGLAVGMALSGTMQNFVIGRVSCRDRD